MNKNTTERNKKRMLEALEKNLGIVSKSCAIVGIGRTTHYMWVNSDEEYREAVNSIEDVAIDFAESSLHSQIQEGIPSSTIFYLKTKGKKRGYIEKTEIEHQGSPTIKVEIIDDTMN